MNAVIDKPEVGVTYGPAPNVVRKSLGLPRTVMHIETEPGLDVFVVHYRNAEGSGFESGNVWTRWVEQTGARPE